MKGESLAEYRKTVTFCFLKITKEQERLAALRMDLRKKKDLCEKAWSNKQQKMKSELKELEEKVALQGGSGECSKSFKWSFRRNVFK